MTNQFCITLLTLSTFECRLCYITLLYVNIINETEPMNHTTESINIKLMTANYHFTISRFINQSSNTTTHSKSEKIALKIASL